MNERIKQLAIKAGGGPSKWYTDPNVLQEFTELIVRECISQIEKQGNGLTSTEWDEGYRAGLNASQKATKEYFGVEE